MAGCRLQGLSLRLMLYICPLYYREKTMICSVCTQGSLLLPIEQQAARVGSKSIMCSIAAEMLHLNIFLRRPSCMSTCCLQKTDMNIHRYFISSWCCTPGNCSGHYALCLMPYGRAGRGSDSGVGSRTCWRQTWNEE